MKSNMVRCVKERAGCEIRNASVSIILVRYDSLAGCLVGCVIPPSIVYVVCFKVGLSPNELI